VEGAGKETVEEAAGVGKEAEEAEEAEGAKGTEQVEGAEEGVAAEKDKEEAEGVEGAGKEIVEGAAGVRKEAEEAEGAKGTEQVEGVEEGAAAGVEGALKETVEEAAGVRKEAEDAEGAEGTEQVKGVEEGVAAGKEREEAEGVEGAGKETVEEAAGVRKEAEEAEGAKGTEQIEDVEEGVAAGKEREEAEGALGVGKGREEAERYKGSGEEAEKVVGTGKESSSNGASEIGSRTAFNVGERSTEFVKEVRQGWRDALETLREQLRDFEDNIELFVEQSEKTANSKREENRKSREYSITNLRGSEHKFRRGKVEKLSSWYVNNSRKSHELKYEATSNKMKFNKKTVENSWQKHTFGKAMNPLEKRRKMLEIQRLGGPMKAINGTYVEEGKEMKSNKENEELIYARLLEEEARLEEARLLREEQMELRKQQELHHGFVDKVQLERHEQIMRRLEQLAEKEREYREQLEREGRIRMKFYMTTPPNESFSSTPIDSDKDFVPSAQCSVIRKFVKVFAVADPIEWIRNNCSIVKIYFPEESCEHVVNLFKSCLQ
ncbi:unnamed protein product, partial [Cercopithifilaria johnstoni]